MKNILVVCRSNSVISPMVAALFNAHGGGKWRAYSAGSEPGTRINAYVFSVLKEAGIIFDSAAVPRNWSDFSGAEAPRFEVILTVSEDVAWENMPVWNGVPRLMHWAMPDPLKIATSAGERIALMRALRDLAEARVGQFLDEDAAMERALAGANDNRGNLLGDVGT